MKKQILILTMVFLILFTGLAIASVEQDINMYHTLFTQSKENVGDLFTQEFLDQVPVESIIQILNQYKGKLGKLQEVQSSDNDYKLIFDKGSVTSKITVNSSNKISGLWFGSMTLSQDDYDKILEEFNNLKSETSVYVLKNNKEEIISLNENKKMAVGSTFKIYVLKALYEQIESTNKDWEDIIKLSGKNRSIPSGILQDWPLNSPVTVNTLANLMISVSDNTATDHLIDYVGKEYLEEMTGKNNTPFLKTTEFFKLKHKATSDIKNKYIEGDLETKREIIDTIEGLQINAQDLSSEPTLIKEIEWFFSTKELAKTVYELRDAEELQINSGLANKNNWFKVGYKGGSEAGVLQYTHLLQKRQDGPIYVVSVTSNSEKGIETNKVTELTSRLISLLNK